MKIIDNKILAFFLLMSLIFFVLNIFYIEKHLFSIIFILVFLFLFIYSFIKKRVFFYWLLAICSIISLAVLIPFFLLAISIGF
ncbi:MAG: hypothetical protein UT13_C0001G0727 [Candidatus Pacebacteria bacterium GW2011_GWF2_38_9]|nr:MAG: hypothetical protein US01_C0001G0760 [candidate division TM6 bacterium GW2011_GWF2_28_16]KKQ10123.1 MAG: hypothetical protein US20_C0003G0063 [Candidatus Pacebacteria bacterium GW2011_GWF1_36_5]KKQ89079.1 MAG: hypothetical protein UT13_C0001G0727 [Candidatus Pacebacteria bacterium GW2011_GWF2_38_9]HAZ73579.1 hypothetical protein [Candidatus Paceibacterota bacterium]